MKVKTSITLSEDLLRDIDRLAVDYKNRSDFIDKALRTAIRQMLRERQDQRDRELLERHADALAREAADALDYQAPV